ncbi:sensor histidine kinase [Desulfolithobacter dissulfuricans]
MVGLGYYVSGRILKPISAINSLAREITDKTLDKRIPLGKNRDELYELSSSLNHMFDRLQYSFQHQKEFLANASHELKTPIAMQRLFFDEALQLSELPDNFRKQLVQQSRILCRMDRLVKNLLDLSALELQAACDPEELDLVELTATVFTEFEDIIRANNIELSLELPGSAFIRADGEKIKRVLINLIDNAIKYNHPEEGRIECRITTENKGIWLEIYNSGPGMPADQLERVFDQFYRVEKSRSTALGGAGLGLTIVKRIIEMHGGTITMESEAGSWTRVRVFFPTLQTDKKRSDSAPLNA